MDKGEFETQKKNQSRIMISEEIGDSATDSMSNKLSQNNDNVKSNDVQRGYEVEQTSNNTSNQVNTTMTVLDLCRLKWY